MSERNKQVCRAFIEEVENGRDPEAIDRFVREDFLDHNPAGPTGGRDGMKAVFAEFFAAFPDLRVEIRRLVAEGDIVAMHLHTTGTHRGDLWGNPPTGRRLDLEEVHIVRIADGRFVEHWGVVDSGAFVGQLGIELPT